MPIEVEDDTVRIDDYETDDPEVVAYFANLKKNNKNFKVGLDELLKLGALATKASNVGLSTDYVNDQVSKMKQKVLDSLQEQFGDLQKITKELLDPNAPASATNTVVGRILNEVEKIQTKLNIREAEQGGTKKGFDFEDYCQPILESIAKVFGDTVKPTGDTEGMIDKKGDFVYTIKDLGSKIVLEMKDMQQIDFPYIKAQLDGGMANRGAQYGIFVSKKREALPNYVGSFNDYDDNKLVIALGSELEDEIIHDDLIRVAIGWARSKLKQASGQGSGIDTGKIRIKIESVQKKMEKMENIKAKCTGIVNNTKEITGIVDEVRADITTDLKKILESMNA